MILAVLWALSQVSSGRLLGVTPGAVSGSSIHPRLVLSLLCAALDECSVAWPCVRVFVRTFPDSPCPAFVLAATLAHTGSGDESFTLASWAVLPRDDGCAVVACANDHVYTVTRQNAVDQASTSEAAHALHAQATLVCTHAAISYPLTCIVSLPLSMLRAV